MIPLSHYIILYPHFQYHCQTITIFDGEQMEVSNPWGTPLVVMDDHDLVFFKQPVTTGDLS